MAVLDTETTGGSHSDEPISIGVVLCEVGATDGEILRELEAYYGLREPRPGTRMNPFAAKAHGLTLDDVRGHKWDMKCLKSIAKIAQVVVAHNAAFDRRMLVPVAPDFERVNWTCSMNTLRPEWRQLTGGRTSLDAICKALRIERPKIHDAMADCRCLQAALSHAPSKGRESLMRRLVERAGAC